MCSNINNINNNLNVINNLNTGYVDEYYDNSWQLIPPDYGTTDYDYKYE